MIWILADEVWEPVAERVQAALDRLMTSSIIVTPEACRDLTVEIVGTELSIRIEGMPIGLPDAVLYLRDPVPQPDPTVPLETDVASFVSQQWQIMLRGLVRAIEAKHIPVLNSTAAVLINEKTAQLISAAECGLTTPAALHSARGMDAADFADRHGDACATKPFAPFVRAGSDGESMQRLLTNRASAADLERGLERATVPSPTIVQPFITAPYEHRVVVIGDQVFSARIARTGDNAVDVRRVSPANAIVTASRLPSEVQAKCVELLRSNQLQFAAIDLLETVRGDYVFLDLNPNGHFLWVEQLTGARICQTLAELVATAADLAVDADMVVPAVEPVPVH
jgi:glutathione synthase/RimK-type ligase-like ATP-grasp enzyme